MAFLAIRVAAYQALPIRAKRVVRFAFEKLDLRPRSITEPPPIMLNGGVECFVFCDPRITPRDATTLAVIVKNANNLPDPDDGEGNEITKADLIARLKTAVDNQTPPSTPEGADPFVYRLTYANAPAAIQMFNDVPDGWHPKPAEE